MGAAALATSALLLVYIRPALKRADRGREFPIFQEHWRYGRWALGSSVFIWVSWNIWYTVVGAFAGLAGTGTLKALVNLAMPVIQSCAALSLLVLPHTARVVHDEGAAGAKRQSISVAALFTAGAAIYWLSILAFQNRVITFLYSGKYADSASALPWLALASVATAATVGPVSALRALEKPSTVCVAFFISSLVGMAVGVPATRAYGVGGAVGGILLSSMLALGITAFAVVRTGQSRI
jgi:O-antigen/teichoic acid export membrane protein